MQWKYSGCEILEGPENAHNDNKYLTGLIGEASDSAEPVDFGASMLRSVVRRRRDSSGQTQSWKSTTVFPS